MNWPVALHPSILIVIFFVFAGVLATGDWSHLISGAFLLTSAFLMFRRLPSTNTWRLLRRLRWIFLTLVAVYATMTPGAPVLPNLDFISKEGLLLGLLRGLILLLLVIAVDLLLNALSRNELVRGLYWLFRPLNGVGCDIDRLVLRTLLTMEYALEGSGEKRQTQPSIETGNFSQRLDLAAKTLQQRFENALMQEHHREEIVVDTGEPPSVLAWLVPVAIGLAMMTLEAAI
ncbi:MAG: hypothetical protein OEZ43_10135 [Gammaproteobacteria bacterium]|nr:hypothetical protein [Gammaproteobacteria bacterium]